MKATEKENCLTCVYCKHEGGKLSDDSDWVMAYCVKNAPDPFPWQSPEPMPDNHADRWSFPRVGANTICGEYSWITYGVAASLRDWKGSARKGSDL